MHRSIRPTPFSRGGQEHRRLRPAQVFRDDHGYWSITVYNTEDRYLISNEKGVYSVTSYNGAANDDGTYTVHINPEGERTNAIPTAGKLVYAIMRVYESLGVIDFAPIREVTEPDLTP